jgi:DtxR family Mn-dependent transcriptional regulator
LIERMLTEMLGMEWYKVHDEAERLEHAVSDDFERKLIQKLGEQGPRPRENEINTGAAERRKSGLILLAEVPAGKRVKVVGMYERDRSLLEYFDGLGLRPGSQLRVATRNYDDTMVLDLGAKRVHLGQAAAGKVWVRGDSARAGRGAV